jgi:Flp pilus assembly protein TadD
LTILVYLPVRQFDFVNWDDPSYVLDNAHVLQGLRWITVKWALTSTQSPYWHPITWLSHILDVHWFGLASGAHHLTSVVIHCLNVVLVFAILVSMTGAVGRSLAVAAVFAVHPLHVESVAWISERKDVLSGMFGLLTIGAYIRYARRPVWTSYAVVLVCFALALMSKPTVVTLPLVLLLLDVWPLGRLASWSTSAEIRRVVIDKLPLLAMAIPVAIATAVVQARVGAVATMASLPLGPRSANTIDAYGIYLRQMIWPVNLSPFYPLDFSTPPWRLVLATLVLVAMTVYAVRARRSHPYVLVGWLWYVVMLVPVIGLVQAGEQAHADRFVYLPILGPLVVLAWGAPIAIPAWDKRPVLAIATAGVVAVLSIAAREQVGIWVDSVTLWQHAAAVTEGNYLAHEKLGDALRDRGDYAGALRQYDDARRLAPTASPAYAAMIDNAVGLVLTRMGLMDAALGRYQSAVNLNPASADVQTNLANALASSGRTPEAIAHYSEAVRLDPARVEAQVGLASALLNQGQIEDAIARYRESVRIDPNLAEAHNGLGSALAMQGKDDAALTQYVDAIRLKPGLASAHANLGWLFARQGRPQDAVREFDLALQIDPQLESAREGARRYR